MKDRQIHRRTILLAPSCNVHMKHDMVQQTWL